MKENYKRIAVCGVFVFVLGIFLGYQLNFGKIANLQGYLFNDISNATDANATDANATDANATDANATSANSLDGELYLAEFGSDGNYTYHPGNIVYLNLETYGACNIGASVVLINETTGYEFTATVSEDENGNTYIELPYYIPYGEYKVTDLLVIGKNSDGTTFSELYGPEDFGTISFAVEEYSDECSDCAEFVPLEVTSFKFNSADAKQGDKLYLTYTSNEKLTGAIITFEAKDGTTFEVSAKDFEKKPYIQISTSMGEGDYTVKTVMFRSENSGVYVDKDSDSSNVIKNLKLRIIKSKKEVYVYNVSDLTADTITKIYKLDGSEKITINTDSKTLIDLKLFKAIKGTKKQLIINNKDNQIIFNGNVIDDPKTIDVGIKLSETSEDKDILKHVNKSMIVEFADNGTLPGKALVRIKITEQMKKLFGNEKLYLYYYDRENDTFNEVAKNIKATSDGYYEFDIDHNSSYVLTKTEIDKEVVSEPVENTVGFQKSNSINLLLIIAGLALVIITVVVIVVVKKKKNKKEEKVSVEPKVEERAKEEKNTKKNN